MSKNRAKKDKKKEKVKKRKNKEENNAPVPGTHFPICRENEKEKGK